MTWRQRQGFFSDGPLKYASFKDAAFLVEAYDLDGGRRQSIQRIPGDRYTDVQDLGRDSSQLSINAFLVGDNYDDDLRFLEKRLLEGGEGELALPWRKPFTCTVVGRISTSETKGERGFARVSFSVLETAKAPEATQRDAAAQMRSAADNARGATRARFGDRFNTANQVESRRTSVRSSMNSASTKVVGVQRRVDGFVAEIAKDANTLNTLTGVVNDLINSPLDLSDAIVDAVITAYSSLRSVGSTAQNVIETWGKGGPLRILADQVFRFNNDFATPVVDTTTPDGQLEQQNLEEFHRLCRLNMFYEMALLFDDLPFESTGQALDLRTRFIEEIDGLLLGANPQEVEAIYALNESVASYLEDVAEGLPRLATYTPMSVLPALVLAHQIYGDARAESDIVLRNNVIEPGFVPALTPLEIVVSD